MNQTTQAYNTSQELIKQKSAPNKRKAALHLVVRRGIEPLLEAQNSHSEHLLCSSHKNFHDKNEINYTSNYTRDFQETKNVRPRHFSSTGSENMALRRCMALHGSGSGDSLRSVGVEAVSFLRPTVAKSIHPTLKQALNAVLTMTPMSFYEEYYHFLL